MTSQYEVLQPFITERIRELVRGRLLEGVKFFDSGKIADGFTRSDVKLVLLLVLLANPKEYLSLEEIGILESRQRVLASDKPVLASVRKNSKKQG